MKPGGSRVKGATFERWVAKALNDGLGLTGAAAARRGLVQSRGGGAEGGDIELPSAPLHFECKHSKADTCRSALRQANADLAARGPSAAMTAAVAVVRKHGGRTVTVGMAVSDAAALLDAALRGVDLAAAIASRGGAARSAGGVVMFEWPDFVELLRGTLLRAEAAPTRR